MVVNIEKDGQIGSVNYGEEAKQVTVRFPDEDDEKAVIKHLTKVQDFRIPESQKIDDFRVDRAKPTDERTYMELALCTLFANTGLFVMWDTLKED